MPIYKGTLKTGAAYKGSTSLSRIYKGVYLVFEAFKTLISEGVPPITLLNCAAEIMLGYKIYGNSKQQLLPDGYTQLEYIQSSGTQYIDTGITATDNTGIKIKYCYTASGSSAISGIFMSTSPRQDTLFISSNSGQTNSTLFCAHRGVTFTTSIDIALNTDYTCEINYLNSGEAYFGDTLLGNVGSNDVYNKTIPLFARYSVGGSNYAISNSRIYYAIFSEGNAISKHFIPAKRNSDNVLGMYDIINNEFKTNVGTGTFTAGPVAPTPNAPIEIESVGDKTKNLWNSTLIVGCMKFADGQYLNYPGYVCNSTPIPVEAGEEYTISANNYDDPDLTSSGFVFYNNGSFVSSLITTSLTVTIPSGVNQLYYNFRKQSDPSSLDPSDITNVQLEKGSSSTSYEPFGYKIPVTISSRNLWDTNGTNYGWINIGGGLSPSQGVSRRIEVKYGETYVYQSYNSSGNFYNCIALYDENMNFINGSRVVIQNGETKTNTVTINNLDAKYLICAYYTGQDTPEWNMICKGDTSPGYEPYFTPTTTNIYLDEPLRKIGSGIPIALPAGYTQLEYIESTGTQYINTGIIYSSSKDYVIYQDIQGVGNQNGNKGSGWNAGGALFAQQSSQCWFDGSNGITDVEVTSRAKATIHINSGTDADTDYSWYFVSNGTTFTSSRGHSSLSTYSGNQGFPLLTSTVNTGAVGTQYNMSARLYRATITVDNVLERDLIPCKNSSNVVGMYDLVNGVFYQNAGTGTFTAGQEIYADYIDFETQKVYRKIGERVFVGAQSENWVKEIAQSGTNMYIARGIFAGNQTKYFLNRGISISSLATAGSSYISANNINFKYKDNDTTPTVEDFKTWLANNNLIIDAVLATPTEESITLPSILLNKDTNVVSVGTSIDPSNMWIKYKGK